MCQHAPLRAGGAVAHAPRNQEEDPQKRPTTTSCFVMLAALLGAGAIFGSAIAASGNPGLDVDVIANWYDAPVPELIIETVSQRNSSAFFPLLSLVAAHAEKNPSANLTEYLLAQVPRFLEAPSALLHADLLLGSGRSELEAQYAAYEAHAFDKECEQVMDLGGMLTCDLRELYTLQDSGSTLESFPGLRESDHIIGVGRPAILYADLSKPESFVDWHTNMLAAALEHQLAYIVRFKPASDTRKGVKLSGYGVQVQLKRTDYLVIDDSLTKDVQLNLDAPSGSIDSSIIPELGFRAATYLHGKDLNEAADIILNFPEHLTEFAGVEPADDWELPSGFNYVSIDGMPLEPPTTDIRNFLETVWSRAEDFKSISRASGLKVSDAISLYREYEKWTNANPDIFETSERFDIRSNAITWLNDVSQDPKNAQLPSSAGEILNTVKGAFPQIRRNIHSVVLALRFDDRASISTLAQLLQLVAGSSVPLQVGVVVLDDIRISPFFEQAAEEDVALPFLIGMLRGMDAQEALENARSAVTRSENVRAVGDSVAWARKFDVKESILFMNGVPLPLDLWQEKAGFILEQDNLYLQNLIEQGELREDDERSNLRDLLLARGDSKRSSIVTPLNGPVFDVWPQGLKVAFRSDKEGAAGEAAIVSGFQNPEDYETIALALDHVSRGKLSSVEIYPTLGSPLELVGSLFRPGLSAREAATLFRRTAAWATEGGEQPIEFATSPEITAETLSVLAATGLSRLILGGRLLPLSQVVAKIMPEIADHEERHLSATFKKYPQLSLPAVASLQSASAKSSHIAIPESFSPSISERGSSELPRASFFINPASDHGQELMAVAQFAHNYLNLPIDIFFAPETVEKIPNRIYRLVVGQEDASFDLSPDTLYTVGVVEPPTWVVTASEGQEDFDNLLLNTVPGGRSHARYSLKALLLEGQSRQPGRALQLRDTDGNKIGDTIIMANLGYFQLQAPRPGPYKICSGDQCTSVWITSLTPSPRILPVFDGSDKPTSEISTLSRAVSKLQGWLPDSLQGILAPSSEVSDTPPVNIFTVASGHLYERFASIMMLSVMRHATTPVKFWLIESFMSPSFKQFLPFLASRYEFEYELVNYKWPSWLRPQTEKQREIWGYKILFLDVLFPQTLHKVIFVDSDQIVRTDMMDLVNEDLEGAPYGYAPMGDDRPEMEGFRFWKQGYWKKLLDGRAPYHISALYVVDLDRFRDIGAGDTLRKHYQQLSADPASLSNLDQDLPNNLQFNVPIHTLDRDWLWCETWCSDESLATARTIDLCNNPLTKEPKLDRARRQIPEWTEYDDEVTRLRAEFFKRPKADVDSSVSHEEL